MTEALSPLTRKLIAILLLVIVAWIAGTLSTSLVLARIHTSQEIAELQEQSASLRARLYDIRSLEKQLIELTAAPSLHRAALIAQTDRLAFADLQRAVRSTIQSAHGTLLSMSEIKAARQPSTLGLQIHARIRESQLRELVQRLEAGDPQLTIGDLSITSKSTAPGVEAEVELTAGLHAVWLRLDGTSR